jgi:hypothetical protein
METWGFQWVFSQNLGFPIDLVAYGGTSSRRDLETTHFVEVVEDKKLVGEDVKPLAMRAQGTSARLT